MLYFRRTISADGQAQDKAEARRAQSVAAAREDLRHHAGRAGGHRRHHLRLSQARRIAFNERDLPDIDFTSLNADQKRAALIEANADRCTCGCGMALAQCVATDMTCPVRSGNITKIRGMVQKALNSGGGS